MNIFDFLARAKTYVPAKDALRFGGRSASYLELYRDAVRLSFALRARFGIEKGDRVGLYLPNIPEFLLSYYGVMRLGAIAVSLNVMLKRDEVGFILKDSGVKLIITTGHLVEHVTESTPSLEGVVCVGEPCPRGEVPFRELLAAPHPEVPRASMEGDEGAAILYTSGTTGKPKGVLLTHENIVSNVYSTNHHTKMTPEDRLICYLPLFHCFGQNFIMNSGINAGATLVLHERFAPLEILRSVKDDAVSMFFGVPPVYQELLEVPDLRAELASVRYYFTAAAPMPVEVVRRWQKTTGQNIYEGYGLTETAPFASYNHDFCYRAGSIGTPIANVAMKIVDTRGNELDAGEEGEILIKGPNVMKGYYHQPHETRRVIRDGWFYTGDIGKTDEQGYFYLVDRAKDMINVSGFKVWPREVENFLIDHPGIREVAVVGVDDPRSGEAVKAFIVRGENTTLTEEDVIRYSRDRMAVYKAPRHVEFVDALPRNPAGKILKRELRSPKAA